MGHKGRQLYICTADICFIIDSTPGKWSPQSPFLPQSPFFSPPIPLVYFLLLLPSRCLHFLQFQVGWFLIKNNSVFVSQRATGKTPPVQSHLQLPSRGIYHIYAQNMWQLNPDNVKSSEKKRKGTLITFLSLMLTLSPSLLISQASVFLWTLKGVFTPRLWLISHPFIWYRVQCRLCRFKKKKKKAESKMR